MGATPLQWTAHVDGRSVRYSHPYVYFVWIEKGECFASRREVDPSDAPEVCIYRGNSWEGALETIKTYCATDEGSAATRRLAWERYMAENDPPSNGEAL